MLSIRDTSWRAISKAGPRKTWGYCHALLGTRNSHSYALPFEILLNHVALSIESNLIHQHLAHLIARKAEIPHGGRGTGMIEPLGQDLEAHPILCPLDESERLP